MHSNQTTTVGGAIQTHVTAEQITKFPLDAASVKQFPQGKRGIQNRFIVNIELLTNSAIAHRYFGRIDRKSLRPQIVFKLLSRIFYPVQGGVNDHNERLSIFS